MNKKGFSILDVSVTFFLTLILIVPIGKYLLSSRIIMLNSEKNNLIVNDVKETLMEVDTYSKEEILQGIKFSKENIKGNIKGEEVSERGKGTFFEEYNIKINITIEMGKGVKKYYELYKTY